MPQPLPAPAQLLAELVALPSVNPMGQAHFDPALHLESRVTDYLEQHLRPLGVPLTRQPVAPGRDNLVAVYVAPQATRTLLWEVHQDTVPVQGMTVPPFGASVSAGRLYGRGACDVKGSMAAMLSAFARLVQERPARSANVVLAFSVDEEHTFLGVQQLVAEPLPLPAGVPPPQYAVVAEPTLLNIVNAHKGVTRWELSTAGRSCHSSRPHDGINAIYRMARLLVATERYAAALAAQPPHPQLGPPTLSVGRVEGGISVNTVPDACRAEIDRRLLPGESAEEAVAHFRNALAQAEPQTPFTCSPPWQYCPALNPTGSEQACAELGQAIDAVVGQHRVFAVPYGTDASTLALAGIPAVVFGPGDIAQAHTRDEWIELAQLDLAAAILYRLATLAP